jgi:prepilin-type N-terminal cleavage/methylation domain-containing protein
MRTMTARHAARPRRGFSLPELLVALLIFAIIGGAIVKTLSDGQRAYDAQVQHIDMQQNMRLASGMLPSELRGLDASDGDIQHMYSDSIVIRSMRQMGWVCAIPVLGGALVNSVLNAATFVVRDSMQGIRYFAQSDSVLIYYEGDATKRSDDTWVVGAITVAPPAALTNCTNPPYPAQQGRLLTANLKIDATIGQTNTAGTIPLGAPVFGFQSIKYKTAQFGSDWYVAIDSAGTVLPIIGPLADASSFRLSYYNAAGTLLTAPYDTPALRATVTRISVALALKTARPLRKNTGSPAADTSRVTLEAVLRNNRRF